MSTHALHHSENRKPSSTLNSNCKKKVEIIQLQQIEKQCEAGKQTGFVFTDQTPAGYIGITIIPYIISNSSYIDSILRLVPLGLAVISNLTTTVQVGGYMLVIKQ